VEDLQKACGLQPAVLSKYEAALAASGGHRTEPESFGRTAIEPGDTLGQVGLAILRRQFATLLAKEPGTRLADNIEELHDMRVASRRLRAALALFRDVLPTEAVRLRPELAWIGQTIGAVRDLDVQLVQIEKWTAVLPEPDREALARLRTLLTEERGRARAEMLQAFDSPRYERFVRRFGATLRSRSGTRGGAARALAPDLIERRHRRLRKAMSAIGSQAEPADYHRLRIAAKRFRYALEFLSDVYPGDTGRLVRRMVALQDLLGAYQDAHVATARLRDLVSRRAADLGPDAVFAMGAIAERYRSRMGEIRPEVTRTYARVTGNAWKRLRRRMEAASPSHPSQ